jgi:hypothetical protein
MEESAAAKESLTDEMLQNLLDNFSSLSPAQLDGTWIDINAQNELINSAQMLDVQDENEYTINAIYLRLVKYGIDSLTQEDKTFISELAPKCPFSEGTAVYKARNLNKLLNPGMQYDNLKICNSIGVYKPSNNTNSLGNSPNLTLYLNEQKSLEKLQPITYEFTNNIALFPNPTSGLVNIQYALTQNVRLEIKDITGRILMQVLMPAGEVKSSIDLTDLASGVYTYNCFVGNVKHSTGKLIKY